MSDVPECSPDQVMVYGVARFETAKINCDVMSNPSVGLRFHWVFNTSGETVQMEQSGVRVEGTRSQVEYTPRSELDYGNLLCWGENSIGVQRRPCTYHIIPAGPPDPVNNCTVFNQTFTGLQITCGHGFDGGLKQTFKLDLRDAATGQTLLAVSQDKSEFVLTGLVPGHGYIITVYSINGKGISEPMTLHAFTLKETSPEEIVADTSRHGQQTDLVVTPVLVILIAILAGLALVAVCIIFVMRVKHSAALHRSNSYRPSSTHIALEKTSGSGSGLNSNHCLSEKNPDIIPSNKGLKILRKSKIKLRFAISELIEEEEAFEIFREQQFATIARRHKDGDQGSSRGFKNNLSRMVRAKYIFSCKFP